MTDVDELLQQVWNPETKSLAEEAWRCYNAGALRASITTTWTAITADIIAKAGHLADDNDPDARALSAKVIEAQSKGLRTEGVRLMQSVENELLDQAVTFELIDTVDKRALDRIREDRNTCVHPSLRGLNDVYTPQSEVARAHLVVALEALLVHPPTQGRKLLEVYANFTCDPGFVPTPTHIQSLFYDQVRTATRRHIVAIAAKHAVLELDPAGRMPVGECADRSAQVLGAIAERDRTLVREAVIAQRDRFRRLERDVQRRTLGRLGDRDYFWDMLDAPLITYLDGIVADKPSENIFFPLSPTPAAVISLLGQDVARQRLPRLQATFDSLSMLQKVSVLSRRPSPYFAKLIPGLLDQATSFRIGEQVGELLVPHARYLNLDDLRAALLSCANNSECWQAAGMPPTLLNLFRATSHLGESRVQLFRDFIDRVDAALTQTGDSDPSHYYRYPDLKMALSTP